MKRLIFFYALLFIGLCASAQSGNMQSSSSDDLKRKPRVISDSMKKVIEARSLKIRQTMQQGLIPDSDTLTKSDYVLSIERVNDNLNIIRDSVSLGFEVIGLQRRIDDMTGDISIIRKNIRGRQSVVNIKNLHLYQSFVVNLNEESRHLQKNLTATYNRVYNAKLDLKTALSDSVFRILYNDKSLRSTYDRKLLRIERKWYLADSTANANVDTLNSLKVKMADNSMSLSNMLNQIDVKLDKANKQLLGPEVNCLWQITRKDESDGDSSNSVISMLSSEKKAIGYYFNRTSGKRTLVFILGIMLFVWLFFKRKQLKTIREANNPFGFLRLKYMNRNPVLSLILLLICLMPFFDAYAPTSYLAIEYLLLLTCATIIFLKNEDITFRFNWLILVALFAAIVLTYIFIEPTFLSRLWLLALHVCIIAFSLFLFKKIRKDRPAFKWIKRAIVTGIILSGLGIISNFIGRFSLSGMLGLASIISVTQVFVLIAFVDIVIEIILFQLQSSRMKKGFGKPFDCTLIIGRIRTPMIIIAIILWLIMLTTNLNIYHSISNGIVSFLTNTRTIGNISFKLLSLLYFFLIIWCAHVLQRLISFLFGETGVESEETTSISKKQHSRLLITRLLVLVGGYLLAIAASGLPLDKLTLLLGALGIGIGMGLQNVVNNFVSGIILIFDGSLQIGDEIEVSGQAGKVKEIGLRASTLSTAEGADVIIPNGNILSQNIVNWTFSNDQKRVMIWFCLTGKELDSNVINDVINETIKNIPNVISHKKPVILYTRVTPENCTITVRFWSTISAVDSVKSESMQRLSTAFAKKNIQFE